MFDTIANAIKLIVTFPYTLANVVMGFILVFIPICAIIFNDPYAAVGIGDRIRQINSKARRLKKKITDIGEEDELASILMFSSEASKVIVFYLMLLAIIKLYIP